MGAPGALEGIGIFYNESSEFVGVGSLYFLGPWFFLFCVFLYLFSVSTGIGFFCCRGVLQPVDGYSPSLSITVVHGESAVHRYWYAWSTSTGMYSRKVFGDNRPNTYT